MNWTFLRPCGGDPGMYWTLEKLYQLFPAYAGVIPSATVSVISAMTFPRPRGGDPTMLSHTKG